MNTAAEPKTYDEALAAYVALVTKVHRDYFEARFPRLTKPTFSVHPGRSFDKIVKDNGTQQMVHSFVAKKDNRTKALGAVWKGDILKAVTYKAPAKHARGSIFSEKMADALDNSGHVKYLR